MTTRAELKSAAKFHAVCARCGKKSPVQTDYSIRKWMSVHEAGHRMADSASEEGS